MARRIPNTRAIQALKQSGVDFEAHTYRYEPRGGTAASSRELGVDEHAVVKTLIFEDDRGQPLVVLMHGDREVSTRNLARTLEVKSVRPCPPREAERHSGYQVGGTSPFGLRKAMPIVAERSIGELERIYINGGRRGMLVSFEPRELERVLGVRWVEVAA